MHIKSYSSNCKRWLQNYTFDDAPSWLEMLDLSWLQLTCSLFYAKEGESAAQFARRNNGGSAYGLKTKGATQSRESLKSSYDTMSEASQATEISQVDSIRSVPVVAASSNFSWAKKRRGNVGSSRLHSQAISGGQNSSALDSEEQENEEFSSKESYDASKHVTWRQQSPHYREDSSHTSDHQSQKFSAVRLSELN